jgi:hypothetical protein
MIGCGSASLSQILRPLLDSRAKLPSYLAEFAVTAHCAVRHADLDSFPTKFHALLDPEYEGAVCYGMDYEAGTDVSFTARATAGGNLAGKQILVCAHAKAERESSVVECLRGATLAWQFTLDRQRSAVVAGNTLPPGYPWSARRAAFSELAALHAPVFDRAVRVALTVNEYQPAATSLCNTLNRVISSPVILCTSTKAAFGERLHNRLRSLYAGALTSSTLNAAYWMPQSVAAVNESSIQHDLPELPAGSVATAWG